MDYNWRKQGYQLPKAWHKNLEEWGGIPIDYDSLSFGGLAENLYKPVGFLLRHVEWQENGCLIYTGKSRAKGYGNVNWQCDHTGKTRSVRAHRLSYFLAHGTFPMDDAGDPLLVRHTCHTPLCVNPDHLLKGTNQQNCDDMKKAGRSLDQKGSKNHNSKLTETQRQQVIEMRNQGRTLKQIGEHFGIHLSTVGKIVKPRR